MFAIALVCTMNMNAGGAEWWLRKPANSAKKAEVLFGRLSPTLSVLSHCVVYTPLKSVFPQRMVSRCLQRRCFPTLPTTKSHAGKPVTISSMAVAQGDEQQNLVSTCGFIRYLKGSTLQRRFCSSVCARPHASTICTMKKP